MSERVVVGTLESIDEEEVPFNAFENKVGGKPVWLNPCTVPNVDTLMCRVCEEPLVFLLQIYAPLEFNHSYHRVFYLFCCRNGNCVKKNPLLSLKVLRFQLPKDNEYYTYVQEEEEWVLNDQLNDVKKLCNICSLWGTYRCTSCKSVYYCSKNHQKEDWNSGHKEDCPKISEENFISLRKNSTVLFKEFEMITSDFDYDDNPEDSSEEDDNQSKQYEELLIEQYKNLTKQYEDFVHNEGDDPTLILTNNYEEIYDKLYLKFQNEIKKEPRQILRYYGKKLKPATPLWVNTKNIPTEQDIPNCECSSKRSFEFQILPQLLYYLSVENMEYPIDWGTLSIFTCDQSCTNQNRENYSEFIWLQPF